MKPHQGANLSIRYFVSGDPGVKALALHMKQGSRFAHIKQPFWIIKAHGLSPSCSLKKCDGSRMDLSRTRKRSANCATVRYVGWLLILDSERIHHSPLTQWI